MWGGLSRSALKKKPIRLQMQGGDTTRIVRIGGGNKKMMKFASKKKKTKRRFLHKGGSKENT